MEELSSSQAVQWNVELEKALRSGDPSASAEVILKMGPRLRRWSQESHITGMKLLLLNLDYGQDIVFANFLLLRLAEAFRTGDNITRFCVLKAFLHEYEGRRSLNDRHSYRGILSREKMPNHVEMLRRVKEVVDNGDIMAKALALRLFGCLADFAKDKIDILRIISDAMDSPHEAVVNSAIFAARCLCNCSKDFSCFLLEKIIMTVDSVRTTLKVKLEAIRLFANMDYSPATAFSAQEAGKTLLSRLPTYEIVTCTLLSLSKLAFQSIVTLPDQVGLLLSYLTDERFVVRAMSLKCIYRLSHKALFCTSFNDYLFKALLDILKDQSAISLHCYAFMIFCNVCNHYICSMDIYQLSELLSITEIACLHPEKSTKRAALCLLVDLTCNIERMEENVHRKSSTNLHGIHEYFKHFSKNTGDVSVKDSLAKLPVQTASLVFDQITSALDKSSEFIVGCKEIEKRIPFHIRRPFSTTKIRHLCNLLLKLSEGSCASCLTLIDCIGGFFDDMVSKETKSKGPKEVSAEYCLHTMIAHNTGSHYSARQDSDNLMHDSNVSELLVLLSHCLLVLLHKLDVDGNLDAHVCDKVHHIANCMLKLDSYFCLLHYRKLVLFKMHYAQIFGHRFWREFKVGDKPEATAFRGYLCRLQDYNWSQLEKYSLEAANNKLRESKFWEAYKIGIVLSSQGAWRPASGIFDYLSMKVTSETCYFWLRSLALSAEAEKRLHTVSLLSHGLDISVSDQVCLEKDVNISCGTSEDSCFNVLTGYCNVLSGVVELYHAAFNSLSAAATPENAFEFQRSFLILRRKLLKIITDVLGLVNKHSFEMKSHSEIVGFDCNITERSSTIWRKNLVRVLKPILLSLSVEFQNTAKSFDLLKSSFMDMDALSFRGISGVALGCSLLAFCCLFIIQFPMLQSKSCQSRSTLGDFDAALAAPVLQDLVQRLPHDDCETWKDLVSFSLDTIGVHPDSAAIPNIYGSGYCTRLLAAMCSSSVSSILNLQRKAKMINHQGELHDILQHGLKLLANILLNWFHIPSQMPRYFFRTRAQIGVEIYVSRMGEKILSGISVVRGCHLSLSLCIQLKNLPPNFSFRVESVFCILYVDLAEEADHETIELIGEESSQKFDLIEELWMNMRMASENRVSVTTGMKNCIRPVRPFEVLNHRVKSFVKCNVNAKGQGFAACLLDVSSFPCGFYKISALCGCLDNRGCFWNLKHLGPGPTFCITPS